MLDPKEYAEQLVEKHFLSGLVWGKAVEHALIDVQSTIDALERLDKKLNLGLGESYEFYNQVKEHIKQL